ncbi:hypothetical protein Tco_0392475 [Tanacetum coccineum]
MWCTKERSKTTHQCVILPPAQRRAYFCPTRLPNPLGNLHTAIASWYLLGTPPRDVIEEIAQTIVATIPNQKYKTKATTEDSASAATTAEPKPTSAKCPILPELSSDTKKKIKH